MKAKKSKTFTYEEFSSNANTCVRLGDLKPDTCFRVSGLPESGIYCYSGATADCGGAYVCFCFKTNSFKHIDEGIEVDIVEVKSVKLEFY